TELVVRRPPSGVRKIFELFALPAVVVVGYLWANQHWFGTPWQISGLTKRAPLDAATVLIFGLFAAAALAVGWIGFRALRRTDEGEARPRAARFPLAGRFAAQTAWFGAFAILVVGYYNVLQVQQWLWYYAPVGLYLVALLLLAVADMSTVALRDAPADA